MHVTRASASLLLMAGASEEQWKADPSNDPLAAPFADVLEVEKAGWYDTSAVLLYC